MVGQVDGFLTWNVSTVGGADPVANAQYQALRPWNPRDVFSDNVPESCGSKRVLSASLEVRIGIFFYYPHR